MDGILDVTAPGRARTGDVVPSRWGGDSQTLVSGRETPARSRIPAPRGPWAVGPLGSSSSSDGRPIDVKKPKGRSFARAIVGAVARDTMSALRSATLSYPLGALVSSHRIKIMKVGEGIPRPCCRCCCCCKIGHACMPACSMSPLDGRDIFSR